MREYPFQNLYVFGKFLRIMRSQRLKGPAFPLDCRKPLQPRDAERVRIRIQCRERDKSLTILRRKRRDNFRYEPLECRDMLVKRKRDIAHTGELQVKSRGLIEHVRSKDFMERPVVSER